MTKIKKIFDNFSLAYKLKPALLIGLLSLPFFSQASYVTNEQFLKTYVNTIIPDESVDTYKYIQLKFSGYQNPKFEKILKKGVYYNILENKNEKISPKSLITTKKAGDYIYQGFGKSIDLTGTFLTSEQEKYIFDNLYTKNSYEDTYYINNIKNFIETNFYTGYDTKKLKQASVNAMVESLGDEYSQYFSPTQAQDFNNQLNSTYSGIGVELQDLSGNILVSKIFSGSAQQAGIQTGDKIISINGNKINSLEDFFNFSSSENFKIQILRNQKTLDFELKKQIVSVPMIEYTFSGGVNYVKINEFGIGVKDEFEKILTQFSGNKFLFDVRDNPGGDVDQTMNILDHFVAEGKEILTLSSRNTNTKLLSLGPADITGNMVVLINENSASASEIFALNMKNMGANLVGKKTFGKGSSQTYQNFDDGSAIKITSALWSVNGKNINHIGISPDFEVSGENEQLKKGLELLK